MDVILLDFAKAFDKVPFSKAFAEIALLRHTRQHPSMDFIFLHGRTQQVLVEGSISEELDVLSGVPQGTVLGPILF